MILKSPQFRHYAPIAKRFSGEGADISPVLSWSEVPEGTKSFALIVEDPDAPVRPGKDHPFIHWVAYNIPANVSGLPEGISQNERVELPVNLDQGINSFQKIGYGGPIPPVGHGVHHYHFTLYALDIPEGIPAGLTKTKLIRFMGRHILATAQLVGTYERKPSPAFTDVNASNVSSIRKPVTPEPPSRA